MIALFLLLILCGVAWVVFWPVTFGNGKRDV